MSTTESNDGLLAALFDGQGVLVPGSGHTVWKRYAAAREVFDQGSDKVGVDLARVCFGDLTYLQDTPLIQPATVAVDLAEYAAWQEINGDADIVSGLSLGMFGAMGAAGFFNSYADAIDASARRAGLMYEVTKRKPGKMAGVVGIAMEELEPMVKRTGAGIAVIRDKVRRSFVVTGGDNEVDELEREARRNGVRKWESLNIFGAFHFKHFEETREPLENEIRSFSLNDPLIRLVGNNALYLATVDEVIKHGLDLLTETSDWDSTINFLHEQGVKRVLEVGPDTSRGLARQMNKRFNTHRIEFPGAE